MGSHLGFLACCFLLCFSGCKSHAARPAGEQSDYSDLTEEPAISLAHSIKLAREQGSSESFLHAELGQTDGRPDCLVVFWGSRGMHYMIVDARSGELVNEGTEAADSDLVAKVRKAIERSGSTIGPAKAIEIAIAAVPGSWAQLINLECDENPLAYMVEVVTGKDSRFVFIGADDGRLLSVRADLDN